MRTPLPTARPPSCDQSRRWWGAAAVHLLHHALDLEVDLHERLLQARHGAQSFGRDAM
jgi:hypothetical protein